MSKTLAQLEEKMRGIISKADNDFRKAMMNQMLFGMKYQMNPSYLKLKKEDIDADMDFWGKSEAEFADELAHRGMIHELNHLIKVHGIKRYATPEMKRVLAKKTKKGRKLSLRVRVSNTLA